MRFITSKHDSNWHLTIFSIIALPFFLFYWYQLIFVNLVPAATGNYELPDDFTIFYHAGQQFRIDQQSLYADLDPYNFNRFIYPPLAILPISTLSYFQPCHSYIFLVLINIFCYILSIILIIRIFSQSDKIKLENFDKYKIYFILLSFAPLFQNNRYGQINCIILLLCTLALYAQNRQNAFLFGLAIALGFHFKLYPIFLAPLCFMFNKKITAAAWVVFFIILFPLIAYSYLPFDMYVTYFSKTISSASTVIQLNPFNQSFVATIMRSGNSIENAMSWNGTGVPSILSIINNILLFVSIGLSFYQLIKKNLSINEYFMIVLTAFTIFSFLGWEYTYIFIVPSLIWLLINHDVINSFKHRKFVKAAIYIIFLAFMVKLPGINVIQSISRYTGYPLIQIFFSRYLISSLLSIVIFYAYKYKIKDYSRYPIPYTLYPIPKNTNTDLKSD